MAYQHGVYTYEKETSLVAPVKGTAGLQVIFGTAPVNMAADPYNCTNVPMIGYDYAECCKNVGYSDDWKSYSLCQSIYANFKVFNVAPIILINVLDPTKHIKDLESQALTFVGGQATINVKGILLDKLVLSGTTEYVADTDYTAAFESDGDVVITVINPAMESETITATGKVIDPTMVTAADIVGGYDVATGRETGMDVLRQIYPKFGMTPGLILAPGWSHEPTVAAVMQSKCENINEAFTCECIIDINCSETGANVYTKVKEQKEKQGVDSPHCLPVWPMVKVGGLVFCASALAGALTAYVDASNEDIPNLSPSNHPAKITATCLPDGTELVVDQSRGNQVNSVGVTTFININGYKLWGGRTACYPGNTDPKDMWFNVRRFFSWRRNGFTLTFMQKVDRNADPRLIQTICDSANIEGNGYVARGYCAGDRITFTMDENAATDILNGTIQFHHYLAPYTPAHVIKDTFEFDVDALMDSLGGAAR